MGWLSAGFISFLFFRCLFTVVSILTALWVAEFSQLQSRTALELFPKPQTLWSWEICWIQDAQGDAWRTEFDLVCSKEMAFNPFNQIQKINSYLWFEKICWALPLASCLRALCQMEVFASQFCQGPEGSATRWCARCSEVSTALTLTQCSEVVWKVLGMWFLLLLIFQAWKRWSVEDTCHFLANISMQKSNRF